MSTVKQATSQRREVAHPPVMSFHTVNDIESYCAGEVGHSPGVDRVRVCTDMLGLEPNKRDETMAENKTKPTQLSVTAFIDAITDPARRADAEVLVKLMQSAAGEKPKMWGPSIIGFGNYHYKYESGREGDAPLVGFSPRKAATVLYGVIAFSDSDALLAKLGKHTTGKGCLYIKKLADVDDQVLKTMIRKSLTASRAHAKK